MAGTPSTVSRFDVALAASTRRNLAFWGSMRRSHRGRLGAFCRVRQHVVQSATGSASGGGSALRLACRLDARCAGPVSASPPLRYPHPHLVGSRCVTSACAPAQSEMPPVPRQNDSLRRAARRPFELHRGGRVLPVPVRAGRASGIPVAFPGASAHARARRRSPRPPRPAPARSRERSVPGRWPGIPSIERRSPPGEPFRTRWPRTAPMRWLGRHHLGCRHR